MAVISKYLPSIMFMAVVVFIVVMGAWSVLSTGEER